MKYGTLSGTLSGAAALAIGSAYAFAHDPNAHTATSSATGESTTMTSKLPVDPAPSAMVMSAGMDSVGKNREQVYQELIRAQHEGQMEALKELYRGN